MLYLLRAKKKRNRLNLKINRKILSYLNRIEKLTKIKSRLKFIFINIIVGFLDIEINRLNIIIL